MGDFLESLAPTTQSYRKPTRVRQKRRASPDINRLGVGGQPAEIQPTE
jgi:hypothetical protein